MGRDVNFVEAFYKLRDCPTYGQECHKRKNKNHWAMRCRTNKIRHASTNPDDDFLIETKATLKEKSTKPLAILKMIREKMVLSRWNKQNKIMWIWWNKYFSGMKDEHGM